MSSGELDGQRRRRFDFPHSLSDTGRAYGSGAETLNPPFAVDERLDAAIARTRDYLLGQQHVDGYWVAELEGDTILESEYILLMAWMGREHSEPVRLAANYIHQKQLPNGGWSAFPGGPLEISGSVKAYFALKLTGHDPEAEYMVRARNAILAAGGAEGVNSFTRFYLALLGILSYDQCPAVPPELILIPKWCPFNIYEMSAWSRTIVIPLSIMWAFRPTRKVAPRYKIDELFTQSPAAMSISMGPCESLDPLGRKSWIDWGRFFRVVDRSIKLLDVARIRPLRRTAIRRASAWMVERFQNSDGLGAIFPPIIWSVVALRSLGYAEDSPEVLAALDELDRLMIRENDTIRLQPCKSPVWDTAIATIALREAGVSADDMSVRRSIRWLLAQEVRRKGDWSVLKQGHEASGWAFEFQNEFYADTDDTSMVLMALKRSLPGADDADWRADFLLGEWSPHEADRDTVAVVSVNKSSVAAVFGEVEAMTPQLNAIWRGANWILAMQGKDGGWGAFDPDNNRELFTRVPFADHNAMIDPSTADLTGRMLEMFADLNIPSSQAAVRRAIEYVTSQQEKDGAWYGRWGVNYIYGTWQCLVGLRAIGIPKHDRRVRAGAEWLLEKQQQGGGWGESCASYDDPTLRGSGTPTASQTAWALMGLMAAGEAESEAVRRGVQFLLDTQAEDGTWEEPWFTGTGFPKVFYLKYHYYPVYFPLMALARYARMTGNF